MFAPALMIKTERPEMVLYPLAGITDIEMAAANKNFAERDLPYRVVRAASEQDLRLTA